MSRTVEAVVLTCVWFNKWLLLLVFTSVCVLPCPLYLLALAFVLQLVCSEYPLLWLRKQFLMLRLQIVPEQAVPLGCLLSDSKYHKIKTESLVCCFFLIENVVSEPIVAGCNGRTHAEH